MTGTMLSSADLDPRKRRLLFRAWHRGTREMDLLLGRFADHVLGDLDTDQLALFEQMLDLPDPELYAWVTSQKPVPPTYDHVIYRALHAFHNAPGTDGAGGS